MYEEHGDAITPADDTVLWRYMDLEKLLAMLCDQSLFLCRLDKLRDPWEGHWPQAAIDSWGNNPFLKQGSLDMRATTYASCWHAGKHESAALWDLYGHRAGIAITSTCGQLKESVKTDSLFYIGKVNYCDFEKFELAKGPINMLTPVFLKRKSFEHEHEVRLVVPWLFELGNHAKLGDQISAKDIEPYLKLNAPFGKIVHRVYVSPTAPEWLPSYVEQLLSKFGSPSVPVEHSRLYDPRVL